MEALEVIRRGAIWRIGIGNKVNIWLDPWLPDMSNPRVETPPAVELGEATVESLKAVSGASWEEVILGDLFNSKDREIIRQIPLSLHPTNDQWQWLRATKD